LLDISTGGVSLAMRDNGNIQGAVAASERPVGCGTSDSDPGGKKRREFVAALRCLTWRPI
jgi:hypothetical protein